MKRKFLSFVSILLCFCTIFMTACDGSSSGKGCKHEFGSWQVIEEATCSEEGKQGRTCLHCSETESETIPATGNHENSDWSIIDEPSCTESGKKERICVHCGKIETQYIQPTGHHFSSWTTTQEPTCAINGEKERSCTLCGEKQTSDIQPTGNHSFGSWTTTQEPTCGTKGEKERTCADCGKKERLEIDPTNSHSYTVETIIEYPSCTKAGTKKLTCANCSAYITESIEMKTLSSQEIYNMAIEYVGEITTYDKNNTALSVATGFVFSSDGKVLTNYHVIDEAYSAYIKIGSTSYKIEKVLSYDEAIDLAIVQINKTFTSYANICKQPISVGSIVYAIGSSRGMTNTFSQGIVTYYNRVVDGVSHIQHDASITNGNSGGPLINEYGEVVGINTWGLLDSQNLNFAVFTAEIDNISNHPNMTMSAFYESKHPATDPFTALKNYALRSGEYNSSNSTYTVHLGTDYGEDNSFSFTRILTYSVSTQEIDFSIYVDFGTDAFFFMITIDTIDNVYEWAWLDDYDRFLMGNIYANTYSSNSLLEVTYYDNFYYQYEFDDARELASAMANLMLAYLDEDLSSAGVTANDLGFRNY